MQKKYPWYFTLCLDRTLITLTILYSFISPKTKFFSMPLSKDLLAQDSWRQRSELDAMADLSPELVNEMERLDEEFWVPGEKLKEIV